MTHPGHEIAAAMTTLARPQPKSMPQTHARKAPNGTQCRSPPAREFLITESPRIGSPKYHKKRPNVGPEGSKVSPQETKSDHVLDFSGTTKKDVQTEVKYMGPRAKKSQKVIQCRPRGLQSEPPGHQKRSCT